MIEFNLKVNKEVIIKIKRNNIEEAIFYFSRVKNLPIIDLLNIFEITEN